MRIDIEYLDGKTRRLVFPDGISSEYISEILEYHRSSTRKCSCPYEYTEEHGKLSWFKRIKNYIRGV